MVPAAGMKRFRTATTSIILSTATCIILTATIVTIMVRSTWSEVVPNSAPLAAASCRHLG